MTSSSATVEQIRVNLASLDNFQLPPSMRKDAIGTSLDAAGAISSGSSSALLLSEYAVARNTYLKNKTLACFAESLVENKLPNFDPANRDQLRAESNALKGQIAAAGDRVRAKLVEVQTKYDCLARNREELEVMVDDLAARGILADDNNEDVQQVDENEMEEEQRRVDSLELQYADLKAKYQVMQDQHDTVQKAIGEIHSTFRRDSVELGHDPKATLAFLQKQTYDLRECHNKVKEMNGLVQALLALQKELLGLALLSVVAAPEDAKEDLILTFRLLDQHNIEIGVIMDQPMQPTTSLHDDLRVTFAKFVTDTVIRGRRLQCHHGNPVFQKEIPPLDDLVRLSQNIPDPKEACRFLVRETMTRIYTTRALVDELSNLEEEIAGDGASTDYKFYSTESTFGDTEQQISFNYSNMVIVLGLTADCPKALGSIVLEQLNALPNSEWNQTELDEAIKRVNESLFKSPVEIARAIKKEIEVLKRNENRNMSLIRDLAGPMETE